MIIIKRNEYEKEIAKTNETAPEKADRHDTIVLSENGKDTENNNQSDVNWVWMWFSSHCCPQK